MAIGIPAKYWKSSVRRWYMWDIIKLHKISIELHLSMPLRAKEYHKRIVSAAGKSGWQGGKHLALSAIWTRDFCMALMHSWLQACVALRHREGQWCSPNGCTWIKSTSKWSSQVDPICFAGTCTFVHHSGKGKKRVVRTPVLHPFYPPLIQIKYNWCKVRVYEGPCSFIF